MLWWLSTGEDQKIVETVRFSHVMGKKLVQQFPERALAAAARRQQLCTPIQLGFTHLFAEFRTPAQLRLPPRELPSLCSCSCVALLRGHTQLDGHAAVTHGRGAVEVSPKPTVPLLLCLFNERRKPQAWFSFAFISSCSLSAVNIRSF